MPTLTPPPKSAYDALLALIERAKIPNGKYAVGQECVEPKHFIIEGTREYIRPFIDALPSHVEGIPIVFRIKEEFWPAHYDKLLETYPEAAR